jgi:1D-myo-inositol-tetrakisphosphate 5-kinase/inositol-polyphosphate multikinase
MTSNNFEHQVAGHPEQLTLDDDPSRLIKRCNDRELRFYADLAQATDSSWKQEFLRILPKVYKMDREESTLVLENLVFGYDQPCIADIKLGTVLYHDSATPEKRARMEKVSGETTSGSLGFRICGMKVIRLGRLTDRVIISLSRT